MVLNKKIKEYKVFYLLYIRKIWVNRLTMIVAPYAKLILFLMRRLVY